MKPTNSKSRVDSIGVNVFEAGTFSQGVSRLNIPRRHGMELRCDQGKPNDPRSPLHVKVRGKSVKEVAVENPLSRGGHTHTHQ